MLISPRVHMILDCILAVLMIVVPAIFLLTGWTSELTLPDDEGGVFPEQTAAWVPIIIGLIIAGLTLVTRHDYALVPAIPMSVHVAIDILLGLALIASPWALGFSGLIAWPYPLLGGVSILIAVLTSKHSTSYDPDLDTEPRARTE